MCVQFSTVIQQFDQHCQNECIQFVSAQPTSLDWFMAKLMECPPDTSFIIPERPRVNSPTPNQSADVTVTIFDGVQEKGRFTTLSTNFWISCFNMMLADHNINSPTNDVEIRNVCVQPLSVHKDDLYSHFICIPQMCAVRNVILHLYSVYEITDDKVSDAINRFFRPQLGPMKIIKTNFHNSVKYGVPITLSHFFGDGRCEMCLIYSELLITLHTEFCTLEHNDCPWVHYDRDRSQKMTPIVPESRFAVAKLSRTVTSFTQPPKDPTRVKKLIQLL